MAAGRLEGQPRKAALQSRPQKLHKTAPAEDERGAAKQAAGAARRQPHDAQMPSIGRSIIRSKNALHIVSRPRMYSTHGHIFINRRAH